MKIDDQPWEKVGWVDAYSESWHAPEYLFEIEDWDFDEYYKIVPIVPTGEQGSGTKNEAKSE